MGPVNSAKLNPAIHNQFQALQELLRQGEARRAVLEAEALLQNRLSEPQRAFSLQYLGEARRAVGDRSGALEAWVSSLGKRYSPQVAFMALELWLLPVVEWPASDQWQAVMGRMVQHGNGAALLRQLSIWLPQLPLASERRRLINAIDASGVLVSAEAEDLSRIWLRLKQLTNGKPGEGDG